ncbi:SDR family NAD(P)-dependent oxidoreductase [Nocardia uniformis]|uniref:SDR family NAD(P)-dependent oxidoreductase n=1 Tax=Nocardia uniformis TaxID=53432 RepID=A0A849C9Y7_9NOCA|nr:type I polyketide synthase [Nocardia uniformis]NNH75643.1 SDR family NAD(P)-dependent oxidoreductase [Nocardia uniformis]
MAEEAARIATSSGVDGDADDFGQVAVIGVAGRFPGAADVATMWERSLAAEVDIVGVGGDDRPGYRGVLADTDRFDAAFFGIPPAEAALIDPQQRVLLEVAQHALDDAGIDPARADGPIASYLACGPAVVTAAAADSITDQYAHDVATAPDFAATRVSYRLGLRGESMTVQTGCSSSLVAVYLAVQSLLSGQSEVAIAGGVSFAADQDIGYLVQEGMITSPTGRCRPFDVDADGAVPGGGAGIVVLCRAEDAARLGRRVHALIEGIAINNDGATKVGFMAPSPIGQAEAVVAAHGDAGVASADIGYVEAHGTATKLGDAIEIEGLRRAFRRDRRARIAPCALGSYKANAGHLDRAAGVAGLIRAICAVRDGVIPPMAGFTEANPELDLIAAGFTVPATALAWPTGYPRRYAGVSSFGVGGTNVHVVVAQQLPRSRSFGDQTRTKFVLPISADTPAKVLRSANDLATALTTQPFSLADVAYTLNVGRGQRRYRGFVVAGETGAAVTALADLVVQPAADSPSVVFAFPGQGEPVVDGLAGLYETEPIYRGTLDDCARRITRHGGIDVRDELFTPRTESERTRRFRDMGCFQPALFAVEWSLAELLRSLGVRAKAVLGHSVGELVAATYAGVLDLDDALALVIRRGTLMQRSPSGSTISVPIGPEDLAPLLEPDTTIAVINGPELVTVTGPEAAVDRLVLALRREGVSPTRLHIHRRPHGPAMREAGEALHEFARTLEHRPARIPILSNVTGDWADERMSAARYWTEHLCSPVRFTDQVTRLSDLSDPVVVEVGPGSGLSRIIDFQSAPHTRPAIALARASAPSTAAHMMGMLWSAGAPVDLGVVNGPGAIVTLPPTPFDHARRWARAEGRRPARASVRHSDPGAWLYEAAWKPIEPSLSRAAVIALRGEPTPWTDGLVAAAHASETLRVGDDNETTDIVWAPGADVTRFLPDAAELAVTLRTRNGSARLWITVTTDEQPRRGLARSDMAVAATRVLPQEYPGLRCHLVYLPQTGTDAGARLLELIARLDCPTVVDLSGTATALTFVRAWPHWRARPLRDGGCYVITGGIGVVGRSLAKAILGVPGVTVIVTGRREPSSTALEELRAVAAANGGSVRYHRTNVTDAEAMTELMDSLRAEFGRIAGVVHAAGFTDTTEFVPAAKTDEQSISRITAAKVTGTHILLDALRDDDADFVLLCSSVSVVLGGLGFGAYIAANAAMDEFARAAHAQGDTRWISVQWDAWTESPRDADAVGPGRYALDERDGAEVFRRALAAREPVLIVSTGELDARVHEVHAHLHGDNVESLGQVVDIDAATVIQAAIIATVGALPEDRGQDLRTLGLESLGILQLVNRIRSSVGVQPPLAKVMANLTVDGLTQIVEELAGAPQHAQAALEIVSVEPRPEYPVSAVQRRWLELFDQGYGHLDLPIDILGPVSTAALASAVETVVTRHSGLRTVFRRVGAVWTQSIEPPPSLVVVELRESEDISAEDALLRTIDEFCSEPVTLAESVPFELLLIRISDSRHILVVHAHHVVFDGWSSSLFLRDIDLALRGELGEPPLQYVDYACAQRQYLHSAQFLDNRRYWTEIFAGASGPTRIVPDLPVGNADTGDFVGFTLEREVTMDLHRLARRSQSTSFSLLMAAFGIFLHELTADTDLVLGTTSAGRPSVETEEIVGVFVNPLPLRLQVDPEHSLHRYLRHVADMVVGFHEHGHYPLEDLVAHVEPFLGMGLNDTFSCYLLYQNYWRATSDTLKFRPLVRDKDTHHKLMRDLEIVLIEEEDGLHGQLWFRPSRHAHGTAEQWAARYTALLRATARATDLEQLSVRDLIALADEHQ